LVKISANRYVSKRITIIRKEVETSTQRLRRRTLKNLEEIFEVATKIAGGEIKHQRIKGKMIRISLNQQRRWLLIAGQAAKIIKNVASNIEEKEIYAQLDELERLVNEAKALLEKALRELKDIARLNGWQTNPQNDLT